MTRSRRISGKVETLVVTRSEQGALATRGGERADVPAEPIERLVDTTGAGDLFAAGFLVGEARGLGPRTVAEARRDRRRRGHPALWRAARGRPQGAGRRPARIEKGRPALDRPISLLLTLRPDDGLAVGVERRVLREQRQLSVVGHDRWPLASSELCMP